MCNYLGLSADQNFLDAATQVVGDDSEHAQVLRTARKRDNDGIFISYRSQFPDTQVASLEYLTREVHLDFEYASSNCDDDRIPKTRSPAKR